MIIEDIKLTFYQCKHAENATSYHVVTILPILEGLAQGQLFS